MFPKRMHHFSPWLLVAINEGNREGNGKIRLIRCPLPGHETIYASSPVNGDIVSTKTAQYPQKKKSQRDRIDPACSTAICVPTFQCRKPKRASSNFKANANA